MESIFLPISRHLAAGESAVLCRVVSADGSTPRGPGAAMAVFSAGAAGTIGGGPVELRTTQLAQNLLSGGGASLHAFRLSPNDIQDIGMICGGDVTILLQRLGPEHLPLVRSVLEQESDTAHPSWLITKVWKSGQWEMEAVTEGEGSLLRPHPVLQEGDPLCYAEPLVRPGRAYIFGGGHVGQALAPVLAAVDFRVVVYDDRPHAATRENFPAAEEVILGSYSEIGSHLTLTEEDYAVVMSPGHQGDYILLEQILRTPATYIGCIGSSRKVAATRERLLKAGFSPEEIDRIHSPIGLPIGAETPAEIAISVAAEMITHRSVREGRRHI